MAWGCCGCFARIRDVRSGRGGIAEPPRRHYTMAAGTAVPSLLPRSKAGCFQGYNRKQPNPMRQHRRITLADAANHLMVSERTLIRHFNKKLGMTPHTYLQNVRIDAAKILLKETNLILGKVAERTGYFDVTYFKRVFRETVGVSPTVFRKTPRRHITDRFISAS
ncbi:conserved hypothetical protein [Ricinus communis]|uniref:HTH araC/xylS-type domain-containing protein n=1 Tax=Ricinus communis TaxID=3988 RepID=B9TGZ7_RICCO|nr:conserved hypothetical protein [Ricinus communis]